MLRWTGLFAVTFGLLISVAAVNAEQAGDVIIDEFTGRTFIDPGPSHANHPNVSNRTANIVWADEAPVIDGRADDDVWQRVEVIGDFQKMLAAGQLSTFQSELRVAYDAEHLYLHIRAIQPNMRSTDHGPSPDVHDAVADHAQVMVQIDPYNRRKGFFQFAISPRGARQDRSHANKAYFESTWESATVIDDDGWSAEMAIPWRELLDGDGRVTSPGIGDVWGFNVNRIEPTTGETSQWSLSGGSVGSYGAIGRVFFRSNETSAAVLRYKIEHADDNRLHPGEGAISLSLDPDDGEGTVQYRLTRDGETVDSGAVAISADAEVPFHLNGGGVWEMDLEARIDGQLIHTARYRHTIPNVAQSLADMLTELNEVAGYQDRLTSHPSRDEFAEAIGTLRTEAQRLTEVMDDADELTPAAWATLLDDWQALDADWTAHRLNLLLMRHYTADASSQPFHAGVVGIDQVLRGDALPPEHMDDRIDVSLAANETESVQVVVYPFWQTLSGLEVELSDLSGEAGMIDASHLSWRIVQDVDGVADHPWRGPMPDRHPDILMPGKPFDAEANKAHRLWINIQAPAGTSAGDYRGVLIVRAEGQQKVIPVHASVHDFELPLANTLEHNHWFWYSRWRRFSEQTVPYTPELYERHLQTMSRYRVAEFLGDPAMWNKVGVSVDANGNFHFNFSRLDPYVELGKRYGANSFWSVMGYYYRFIAMFNSNVAEHVRVLKLPERKSTTMAEVASEWIEANPDPNTADIESHPAYLPFIKQWVAYLRKHDVLETGYFEAVDEADRREDWWLDMIGHHEFLKEHAPDLKTISFGATPRVEHGGRNAVGLMDVWCPHLYQMEDESLVAELQQRREDYGEKYWFYICTERQLGSGENRQWSPHVIIGRPWSTMRVVPWFGWKYQVDGFFMYSLLTNPPLENKEPPVEERWPNQRWKTGLASGSGLLLYFGPAPEYEMIPSIRLSHLRDGLEDYEYFHLLRQRYEQYGELLDAADRARVEQALAIDPQTIAGVYEWTTDMEAFQAKRRELAELITLLGEVAREQE